VKISDRTWCNRTFVFRYFTHVYYV